MAHFLVRIAGSKWLTFEYRNMAPPSIRQVFAYSLESVLRLRTTYETDEPTPRLPKEPNRRRVKGVRKYKHLRIED